MPQFFKIMYKSNAFIFADEEVKHPPPPESPVKAIKAQLKEQKILEKKRQMRRQRSLKKKYFTEDYSSPVQENLKESLKVDKDSATTSSEIKPVTPIKRPMPGKIKPKVLSFHLRFRERRIPQVENHFLLCSCLTGEQQKKMSSRQQKQKSKRAGKLQAKFSFQPKPVAEKSDVKKQQQQQTQRGRSKKAEEEGRGSDASRSSTPVQDEIPVEMVKEEKPKRGRGRPRKVEEQQAQDQSRSSTPVQDEMMPVIFDVASTSKEVSYHRVSLCMHFFSFFPLCTL